MSSAPDAPPVHPGFWRDALRRRMLAGADVASAAGASAAVAFGFGVSADVLPWALLLTPVWILLAKLHGLYDRDHRLLNHTTADELTSLVGWSTTATAAFGVALALAGDPLTVGQAIGFWAVLTCFVLAVRAGARALWRRLTPPEKVLIVGDLAVARAVRRKLELSAPHLEVVGLVHGVELDKGSSPLNALTALLSRAQQEGHSLDRVIIATSSPAESFVAGVLALCREIGMKLNLAPPGQVIYGSATRLDRVAELGIFAYNTTHVPRSTTVLKRALDVFLAVPILMASLPVLAVIAVAIRLEDGGPVLFRQMRAGRGGAVFSLIKFRTMDVDAEAQLAQRLRFEEVTGPAFRRDDSRRTRTGRFLRRWSLDELPQLWHVLKGEMSLVGPRPERVEFVETYSDDDRVRLAVKPGITGPMQVFGRSELTQRERLALERDYVENLSLAHDFRILALTVPAVIRGRGAY